MKFAAGFIIVLILAFALFVSWINQRSDDITKHCHELGGRVHWTYGLGHLCVKDGLIIND